MNFKYLLIVILVFESHQVYCQNKTDSTAQMVIEINFKIIKERIENSSAPIKINKVQSAISFFTTLTGIPSESNGDFFGQYQPTREDYEKWQKWYFLNKSYLFWDEKTTSVFIVKGVKINLTDFPQLSSSF